MKDQFDAETSYRRWRWSILWVAAASLLLFGLGARGLWGSEDRWAEVVREMFLTGDFLHPRINWEPYFDKPLLSYWFIAAFAWFQGGAVDEFLSRLPSALSALGALAATAALGRRVVGAKASYYACWILLTVYSFAFWGRTAAADMENVAFTFAALAWYFARKDKPGFLSYFVFFALCAVGGQTKGMGAIAIPVALALVDMFVDAPAPDASAKPGFASFPRSAFRGVARHVGWSSILAGLCGAFVYFIPFIMEATTRSGDYASSGLSLAFKENVQRFFDPFDHDAPFYMYFVWLPQLMLPWTPFLLLAVVWAWKFRGRLDKGVRWVCVAALATFAIFTLSGSRRVYYILPMLPLCALLCGAWLDSSLRDARLDRLKDFLFKLFDRAIALGAPLLAIVPLVAVFTKLKIGATVPPPQILVALSLTGALTMLFRALTVWRLEGTARCEGLLPGFLRFAIPVWMALFAVYALLLPSFDAFRTGKAFAKSLSKTVDGLPSGSVAFIRKAPAATLFYMGVKGRAELLDAPEDLEAWLSKPAAGARLIVSENGSFESLPPRLKARLGAPLASEPLLPWERSAKRKLRAFVVFPL